MHRLAQQLPPLADEVRELVGRRGIFLSDALQHLDFGADQIAVEFRQSHLLVSRERLTGEDYAVVGAGHAGEIGPARERSQWSNK